MTADGFRAVAINGGYGHAKNVDAYIKRENKEIYTNDDLIGVFRFDEVKRNNNHRKRRDLGNGNRTTKHYLSMRTNSSIKADTGE